MYVNEVKNSPNPILEGIKGLLPAERARRKSQDLVDAISPISEQILPSPEIILFNSSENPIFSGPSTISHVSLYRSKDNENTIYYQIDELYDEEQKVSGERVVLETAETGELSVVGAQSYIYPSIGEIEGETIPLSGWYPHLDTKTQNSILNKAHATLPHVKTEIGLKWFHKMDFDQKTELLELMLNPIKTKFSEKFNSDLEAVDGITQSIYDDNDNPIGPTNITHLSVSLLNAFNHKGGVSNNSLLLNLQLFSINLKFAHPDPSKESVEQAAIDFQVLPNGQLELVSIVEIEMSDLKATYGDSIESPDERNKIVNSAIEALDYLNRGNKITDLISSPQ